MVQKKILLVISCSKKKAALLHETQLPAVEAYTGPMFQVIEKAKQENRWVSDIYLGVISAKYGFLRSYDYIKHYDERMTSKLSQLHNPKVIQAIKMWHKEEKFDLIYVLMGKDYLNAVNGLKEALDTEIIIENMGGLGIGQRKLKDFIDRCYRRN